jgi:hypothetical protein
MRLTLGRSRTVAFVAFKGAVGNIRPSLKQLDAAEVGVLDLGTESPDQCRHGTGARRTHGSGYLAPPVGAGGGEARDRADYGVVHLRRLRSLSSLRR